MSDRLAELTSRERETFELLRLGLTNEEIAQRLDITLDGAKYHVSQILSKLGVSSREEAAEMARARQTRRGWLAWPLIAKIAAGVGAAGILVLVAGLAYGVVLTGSGTTKSELEFRPTPPTGEMKQGDMQALYNVFIGRTVQTDTPLILPAGQPATLANFFAAAGGLLASDSLRVPGDSHTYHNGDDLPGTAERGSVFIVAASGPCDSLPITKLFQLPDPSYVVRNGDCIRVAFSSPEDQIFHEAALLGANAPLCGSASPFTSQQIICASPP
jgi:DNA-binding CsgD family transcriptional regulator